MFVSGRPLQPSLMFSGKARDYPRVEGLKGASLGSAPFFPTNIRQGWKGLPETNTLISKLSLCHDTHHIIINDTHHNDFQHNDTLHNDTQDNDTQHNDTQQNDTQHYSTQGKDAQHTETFENDIQYSKSHQNDTEGNVIRHKSK